MTDGLSRRGFLATGAGVGAGAVVGGAVLGRGAEASPAVSDRDEKPAASGRSHRVELRTGTDVAAQVSPDGKHVAFDTVGVLWVAPTAGGKAKRLTDDTYDIAQPDWSPDGKTIAFQSYRAGTFDLWTIDADGGKPHKLTNGPYDHREPRYSPDGRYLAFSSDLAGSYAVYTLDLRTGDIALVTDTPLEEYEPSWSPDGTKLVFVAGTVEGQVTTSRVDVITLASGTRETVVPVAAGEVIHSPAFTPDGKDVVYQVTALGTSVLRRSGKPFLTGEQVFPFRVSWLGGSSFVYTADGRIKRRNTNTGKSTTLDVTAEVTTVTPTYTKRQRDFEPGHRFQVKGIGSPMLSPDGKHVAFRALNDIYVMRIGGRPKPLTRDSFWKSDPAWSPDGKQLSYSSDRGGKLEIWVRDVAKKSDRKVAALPDAAAVSGTWSPDGKHIAFLDQTGAVYTVALVSGDIQRVYPATFEPGKPTWSKNGKTIALAAIKPYSARYREGLSEVLAVDLKSGKATYHQALPNRSIQTRGDDGPVWSPDGKHMAVVVANHLWLVPVSPDGTPRGAAKQVTREVTDAPSWSGDSKHLLYLNNGRLRTVTADGRNTRTVDVPLNWRNAAPSGRTVVHAGRMWDGKSTSLRKDVDIVIDENRIVAVEPHRAGRPGRKVDASKQVVIPGLIDIHNHREMQGYSYGDRQGRVWLALGITTTRSPGSPAYHMVEERESFQSGLRVGPRYYGTGEAVDGSRIYYNFMRPTFDDEQVEQELERAKALDYDMVKSYVRLSTSRQRRVIEWAHEHRIHQSTHYHYPSLAFGGDGVEHIGATNRFGYSRTVTALGTGYQDVRDIFASCGARRTPTLFGASTLYGKDRSLVDDDRVKTLYPSWEYGTLTAAAELAASTDQTVNEANLKAQVRQVVDLLAAGGNVVTGTDSPIDHTAVSTHMNLRAMVRYGVSEYEAMVSATSASGEYLNEPIGRVAAGMYADLTFLAGNPLEDIEEAADVRQVMVNGVLRDIDELTKPFAQSSAKDEFTTNRMLDPLSTPADQPEYWWHDPEYLEVSKHSCCSES